MCVLALMGDETEDEEARVVGAQLVGEALMALVGFKLPDEQR